MEKRTIKIADGNKVTHGDKVYIMEGFSQLWDLLGWDIKNDEQASECATEITRCLVAMGFVDLSPMSTDGKTLTVEVVPVGCWDAEVAKGAEIFTGREEDKQ